MWSGKKSNNYKFFDRTIREQFHVGGVGAIVHKYIGPEEAPNLDDPTRPNYQNDGLINETTIQDMLFMENRDRKYDADLYELRGVYNVSDNDFDLTQFGLFLTNDTLYMTFHLNEMVEMLGRKLMNGDVIELPHLAEEYALDANSPPIPKFYTVTDGNRGGAGFSSTWYSHIWRIKLEPITNSQEFDSILGQGEDEGSMAHIFSTFAKEIDIRDAVVEAAADNDPIGGANPLISHLHNYVDNRGQTWDAGETVSSGDVFPTTSNQRDLFIRTDFQPNRMFGFRDNKWIRLYDNIDDRTWSDRTFNGSTFVNNIEEDVASGNLYPSRQSITDAILPRADFDGITTSDDLVELIDLNALLDNLISEDGVSILVSESGDNIILE
jgi:hypothetical protein